MTKKIKFKKAIQCNHTQYYLTICNQTNFLEHSIYDSYPLYLDYEALYKLGVSDTFEMDDNSLIYTLIVEYFALDKKIYIIAPNLKEIDQNMKPENIFWSHHLHFDNVTSKANNEISQFEFVPSYKFSSIKKESISHFIHAFQSAITDFTFIIEADKNSLLPLLNNKNHQPTTNDILTICDFIVTLKIVEDDEGKNNYILIQSKHSIEPMISKLEKFIEIFSDRYNQILRTIKLSEDISSNTKKYIASLSKLREDIFNIEHISKIKKTKEKKHYYFDEEKLLKIEWDKLSTANGINSGIVIPNLLKEFPSSFDTLYNLISRQGDVYTASYFAIPFFIELIKKAPPHIKIQVYDMLFEIINGYSAYNEKVMYQNNLLELKKANYKLAFEFIELYFKDLTNTKDKEFANYVLDVISLFLDEHQNYLYKLKLLAKNSVIKDEILEIVCEYKK